MLHGPSIFPCDKVKEGPGKHHKANGDEANNHPDKVRVITPFVGGGCGIYEGVLVRRRAVLASGTILTASTVVFDLPNERELRGVPGQPLEIPEGAVVVPGSRPAPGKWAAERGISLAAPVIIKYRDAKTDAKTALEGALR